MIAVVGGDGTVQQAARGLAGTSCALGLVPAGRGNDLARALGVPRDPARAADVLLDGEARTIDLAQVGSEVYVTVATFGFDALVADIVHRGQVPGHGRLA